MAGRSRRGATRRAHVMPFGAVLVDGGVDFCLWAPAASRVEWLSDGSARAMQAHADGWFSLHVPGAAAGTRYAFRIDGGTTVPDPASRSNPDDVHQPSEVVDPCAYAWHDGDWRGRPWHEAVVYELHIGAFTPQGTFAAAIDRLDDLVALGVTALEIMPVAEFPGRRNWGYDGVLLFAPDATYGRPEDFKRLVDAAHARGLMVLLDVVYNHFGPDGNYLHAYAPAFFSARHHTPWGAALNFDGADSRTVRDFFIHNALYWLEEFHVDGLRLDAVHAIVDDSELHLVEELAAAVHAGPGAQRLVHLVLENDHNSARLLRRGADGRPQAATAQWNDDLHHAAHVLASGERDGYYADYAAAPAAQLARALAEGFAFQGEASAYRNGARRGEPSATLPPAAFLNYLQTHDQVGNRAFGERIAAFADPAALRALYACLLLAPSPPLLFMGEEYAAGTPFLYFCDYAGELAHAVTEGRRREFARFAQFADPQARARIPDPNDERTFARSRLDIAERLREPHAGWLAYIRGLLQVRRTRLAPLLGGARSGVHVVRATACIAVRWPLAGEATLHLLANLDAAPAAAPLPPGEVLFETAPPGDRLAPWTVRVSLE
jgi:maltooligosyltrehalose trehalohydrolase